MIENNKKEKTKQKQTTISIKNKIPQQHKHLPSLIQKKLAIDRFFSATTPTK